MVENNEALCFNFLDQGNRVAGLRQQIELKETCHEGTSFLPYKLVLLWIREKKASSEFGLSFNISFCYHNIFGRKIGM